MTPSQQKAYYAKNKADAKVKEDKAVYELMGSRGDAARKGMEEGRMDAMGTTYKKGGKVMKKKMKRFEEGGEIEFETKTGKNKMIDDDTRIKAADYASLDVDSEPRITKDAPKSASKSASKSAPKDGIAFTRAETGGGAALMTRKDRSSMPKATPQKSSSYTVDHTMGNAMKAGGKVSSASRRADGCCIKGKTKGKIL